MPDPASNEAGGKTLKLAEMLSDLITLRVCDQSAALALVSTTSPAPGSTSKSAVKSSTTTKTGTAGSVPANNGTGAEEDVDLNRAKELLRLHNEVHEAERRGELSAVLEEARRDVLGAVGVI